MNNQTCLPVPVMTAPQRVIVATAKARPPAPPDPLKCKRNRTGTSVHRCEECIE